MKEILELPYTSTGNPKRIHEFHDKLSHNVQSLETLNSLHEVNGMVSLTLDKLPIIRKDFVRNDPEWETWDFVKFTKALRQWTRRNQTDNFKLEDSVIPEMRPRVPNKPEKDPKMCLLPSGRSQAVRMCKNCLTDRTHRISGYKKALFQSHWSAQIIGMQKHRDQSTLW